MMIANQVQFHMWCICRYASIHAGVCADVHAGVCADVNAGVCVDAMGPLQVPSTLFFETSSLTEPGFAISATQAVHHISGGVPASASLALELKAYIKNLVGDLKSIPHATTARLNA